MINRLPHTLALAVLAASAALAQDHWVATWAATQQQPANAGANAAANAAANAGGRGPAAPTGFKNQTVRMIVHTSALTGPKLRLRLSNEYGTAPLSIGAVHVAKRARESEIAAGTDRAVTFGGKATFSIPAGKSILSDDLDMPLQTPADLAVSIYVTGDSGPLTRHGLSLRSTYISKEGDFTASPSIADATVVQSWYWLSEVDVFGPANAETLVALGDSITDGARSTPETDHTWPAILTQRLASNKVTAHVGVVNEGLAGNRLLTDGAGTSALGRFDRDVLNIAGVTWVALLLGINDIAHDAKADDLIAGLRQLAAQAHSHSLRVVGCTLPAFGNAANPVPFTEARDAVRQTVNQWIRTNRDFDSVADFDEVTRDGADAKKLRAEYDSGDHIHPNDAGYRAMAESFDLRQFR